MFFFIFVFFLPGPDLCTLVSQVVNLDKYAILAEMLASKVDRDYVLW